MLSKLRSLDYADNMEPRDPNYRKRVEGIFANARFMNELGVELVDLGPGWCEVKLAVQPTHLQQDKVVHAAVMAAMADHSAGGAAGTLCAADQTVLTVEFKINLLRPAVAETLRCKSQVLKAGKTLTICESEVHADGSDQDKLISKAIVSLALVKNFQTE